MPPTAGCARRRRRDGPRSRTRRRCDDGADTPPGSRSRRGSTRRRAGAGSRAGDRRRPSRSTTSRPAASVRYSPNAPRTPSITPNARSSRRPISPNRHAGPCTTLSFQSPTSDARSTRIDSSARPSIRAMSTADGHGAPVLGHHPSQLRTRLGETGEHATGRRREELAHRRRLGKERPQLVGQRLDARGERRPGALGRPDGERQTGDRRQHVEAVLDPRLGHLGVDEPARAVEHHLHRASEDLGALHRPARPEQRLGRTCRNRCDQVDLRQRVAATQQRWRNRAADHPDVLRRRRRRPDRVVTGEQHPGAAALQHVDALVARHQMQPQRDRTFDEADAVEARPRAPGDVRHARRPA